MPLLSHSTMAAGITADITRFTLLSLSLLLSFSLFPDSTTKARHNKIPHIHYYRLLSAWKINNCKYRKRDVILICVRLLHRTYIHTQTYRNMWNGLIELTWWALLHKNHHYHKFTIYVIFAVRQDNKNDFMLDLLFLIKIHL